MDQLLARTVNRRIHRLTSALSESQAYVCECGGVHCEETVHLRSADFEAIVVDEECYVLVPGHDGRGTEVVRDGSGYVVVRAVLQPSER